MSSSDRRAFLLLLAALPLAGCGFEPAYGTGGPAERLKNSIRVADPTDRHSYNLVGRLEERLRRPVTPRYMLDYTLTTESVRLAITPAQEITRYNITGKVDFTLTEIATGETVYTGSVNSFTGYSASGTPVATQTAERDAYDRLMIILADQMVTRLIASSGNWGV
ncbi:MAG: hypothetical protein CL814_00440 [Confluentimicrobium sp.]|jgi:LPS-assembly lipoprotein|uniref:LPS-assembly lipoprotein n=1 Tax=Actibacterium naphthalenivorans TaxID=1614693 RepID=A0A840CCK2_9RHOB|nr:MULTISPECIES: LPS assembly lipoprotein LptE [Actibacterium]ALG91576.1 hypothetical protein TQ29_16990 [Actibacterium sp. EMB200-NS6]MBB4021802.1 LPS-assembly lipoprotein [Actibacterium naphthalenivorans]MBC55388.1 hypothetical protein [Actibacterium sp.]MDY6859712.1 LPS assembly lipoprotein LptE [Pseudomonadota bacterium]|tara:strand:+ start:5429 stop:5923 length:495 start_codon:yes stop_codon:yes gene_type:complete